MEPSYLYWSKSRLRGAAINRSPTAYDLNPEEEKARLFHCNWIYTQVLTHKVLKKNWRKEKERYGGAREEKRKAYSLYRLYGSIQEK